MANIKSQIKRIRTNERNHERNKAIKSSLKTAIRKVREAVDNNNAEEAATLLREAGRKLDKAVSKGTIHRNQAANKKSALALAVNKISAEGSSATEEASAKPAAKKTTTSGGKKAPKTAKSTRTTKATKTTKSTSTSKSTKSAK